MRYPMVDIDQVMLALRSDGLSYTAISRVLERYHGWRLPPEAVRRRCRQLGAAPARGGHLNSRTAVTA